MTGRAFPATDTACRSTPDSEAALYDLVHEAPGLLVSLHGGAEDPLECLLVILLDADTLEIHHAELELGLVESVDGRLPAPVKCLVIVTQRFVPLLVNL